MAANYKITSKQVKDFWKYMAKKYNFDIVDKDNAREMKIVGGILDAIGVQSKKEFLENYTTTVCIGDWRAVYVPFEIGKGNQAQLIKQVIICVHEAQHAVQASRNKLMFAKYLADDTNRANYEAEAYGVTMEMHYFFYGTVRSPKLLADKLKRYSIGKADRRTVEKTLISLSKTVKYGGVINGTSKVAIKWWRSKLSPPAKKPRRKTTKKRSARRLRPLRKAKTMLA
jgi:hypothetical protein